MSGSGQIDIDSTLSRPRKVHWLYPAGAAVMSALGGLLFGYDTGVISGAMIQLRQQFALSYFYQELIVSVTLGSAAFAALCSAGLTDWVGRKPVIILASFIFTVGAVVLGVAHTKAILLVGRVIVGFGIGMASMTVPVYIVEISPTPLRGALVTLNTVCITAGQMLAAIIDGIFMFDSTHGWRYMLGLGGIPSFIQFFGFFAMPETPRWLVQHGRFVEAKGVLIRIHGEKESTPEVEADLETMIASTSDRFVSSLPLPTAPHDEDNSEPGFEPDFDEDPSLITSVALHVISGRQTCFDRLPIIRIIRHPPTRYALIVGCSLQLFQQLVGINTVMYYSASIISMAGVSFGSDARTRDSTVVWIAAVVASTNFVFCTVGLWLVPRFRRRTLLLSSLTGVFISLLLLGVSFQLIASTSQRVTIVESVPVGVTSGGCFKASTCDSCMRTTTCGFCYVIQDGSIVNASCLPAPEKFAPFSSYGRCANNSAAQPEAKWAFDHCPTPYGWLTVLGLVLYLVSFAPGMASLPWTINSELYPTWARSTGVACSTGVNWLSNIIVSLSFLSFTEAITRQGTYFLYSGITVFAIGFVYKYVPETSSKSLEEVNESPHEINTRD